MDSLLKGEGYTSHRYAVQCGTLYIGHIPCSCSQVYIAETKPRLEARLREHQDACKRGMTEKCCGGACVGEPSPHQLGGDIGAGQGQGTTARKCFNWNRGLED